MFRHPLKLLPFLQVQRISPVVVHLSEFCSSSHSYPNELTKYSKNKAETKLHSEPFFEQDFLVKLKNDPDIFGPRDNENVLDEGDREEENFLQEKVLRSQQLTTVKYASIIKSLIGKRKIKEAIDVLEVKMLKEDKFKPENYIYNLVIGACGMVGYTKKAFSLFNDMKKRGLKVTGGTYTALFNACANSPWPLTDGLTRAKHLRDIMIEKMYEPNDSNYNAMIKAFGRCGDLHTAFSIVDEMMSKKIKITDSTINFLFQACISDKESGFRHSLLVWRKMLKKNIKPSIFSFNLILRSIRECNLGNIEVTRDVISQILDHRLFQSPNKLLLTSTNDKLVLGMNNSMTEVETTVQESSINNLSPNLMASIPHMGNLISLSEVKNAEDRLLLVGGMRGFLDIMKEHECEPTIKTYTLLLDVIPSTTAAEKELLSIMKKRKVKFDVDFFNMMIKKKSLRLDYQGAKDVLDFMKKYNLRPNIITYGVLALGCQTKKEALEFIAEMKSSKYRLNTEILGAMVHQACYHTNFSYVLEIMDICVRENVQPNRKFIEHLDKLKRKCRQIINRKDSELGNSKSFKVGFQIFRLRYKDWLTQVKIEDSDENSPWAQFQENTDTSTDKYYRQKDITSKFKPRHTSQFKVKTSPKHFNNTT
ncbi:hypothetical protein WA026_013157 [Henosepilachna vigintioctopunctata]|uniref:Pentatricopeptide repeat-containing protein 1, mitochondrial n=1 Tax=Henosepilachna vigintioctopunctata TaxID=420089 RepID=A0AAW1UM17_9CUCU